MQLWIKNFLTRTIYKKNSHKIEKERKREKENERKKKKRELKKIVQCTLI